MLVHTGENVSAAGCVVGLGLDLGCSFRVWFVVRV